MKKIALLIGFFCLISDITFGLPESNNELKVQIETDFGIIKIRLYDETPLHRDNFIKLLNDGVYTDLLFHRVIQGFMIQGGDPDSKNAEPGKRLGEGDLGYTIPAEFNPKFFHHRGVLAAAREGDQANPEKRSSASQFYILQGKVFRSGELDTLLVNFTEARKVKLFQDKVRIVKDELNKLNSEGKQDELTARLTEIKAEVSAEAASLPPITFSEEQRNAYTTVGGYPSLDNNYTIFGEVIEGLNVIDQIASQEKDQYNRPLQDIRFKITLLK